MNQINALTGIRVLDGTQFTLAHGVDFVGRTYLSNRNVFFNSTASGFEVHFVGTSLLAVICSTYSYSAKRRPYLSIFVDGETNPRNANIIALTENNQEVILAEHLSMGQHIVKVFKRSEASQSSTALSELKTDGSFVPILPRTPLKLEFIGDSLTSGFGNLGKSAEEPFRTETEDGLLSYASLSARMFAARYHIFSVSGIGLYKSPYANINMAQIYAHIDLNHRSPWDFTKFSPDAVLINLGANDDIYMDWLSVDQRPAEIAAFRLAYLDFIRVVRDKNPQAFLGILVIPAWFKHLKATMEDIVNVVQIQGDQRIALIELGSGQESDGMGSSYHPTDKTHIRQAEELTAAIERLLFITRKLDNIPII